MREFSMKYISKKVIDDPSLLIEDIKSFLVNVYTNSFVFFNKFKHAISIKNIRSLVIN